MRELFLAVGKYGTATVIAIYLVYQLASTLPQIQAQHVTMMELIGKNHDQINTIIDTAEKRELRSLQLLRAICLILSDSNQEKLLCNPTDPSIPLPAK